MTMINDFGIVTPSFNQADYINQAVDSVLSQKGCSVDYIVMDGGSDDGTTKILVNKGIKYISKKDKGQSNAINNGFGKVNGEIMGWLNSDDFYLPGALSKVKKYFEDHPEVDIIYGDYAYADESGKIIFWVKEIDFFGDIFWGDVNFICQPAVFWRKKVWQGAGPLDESNHLTMDLDLWRRILTKGYKIAHIREYLAVTRWHSQAKSIKLKDEQKKEKTNKWGVNKWKLWYRCKRQIIRLISRGQVNVVPYDTLFVIKNKKAV